MSADDRNLTLRTLDVLEALCGYAASGATNGELAEAVKTTPPNITRAMAQLIAKGWARKSEETGRFFPAPEFSRLAFRVLADFDRMLQRLDDQRHSHTGTPNHNAMLRARTATSDSPTTE
jgi:DNA-binding IclR family transcriptional regulator